MIRFGTAGWRGVISDEFTFANVRKVAHALSGSIKENPENGANGSDYLASLGSAKKSPVPVVIVGYDTRFMSDDFAHEVAAVFASDGIKTLFSKTDLPTPAVGVAVRQHKAVGGVMITASHNPAHYNGFKWIPWFGGAASRDLTDDIERRAELLGVHAVKTMSVDKSLRESWVEEIDVREAYFKTLSEIVDLKTIKKAGLKIGVDSMHGSGRLFLRPFLEKAGITTYGLHESRDVLYGGRNPEPSDENLGELKALMAKHKLHLGVATDGDADRFGILDTGGKWISANEVLALALEHLVVNRGYKGKIARSVMTSHFIDAVGKAHGCDTRETPVGFKHLGELLRTGQYVIAGEESGGMSIRGHIPDKDGLLACLLMIELMAVERKPLSVIRDRLFKKVGSFHNVRLNVKMERHRDVLELEERLRTKPPLDLAGGSVWRIDQQDGYKFILRDGSWLGLRSSGTEPVFRVYAEASSPKKLDEMVAAGKKLIQGKF
jgi:phosphomannomutase